MNMDGFTSNTFGWIVLWGCLALGMKLAFDRFGKRAADRREDAKRTELKRLREAREDKRPTLADASQAEFDLHRRWTAPRDDSHEKRSAIWAKLMLDADLGRHAESPPPFGLDQSQRDTLLANARKDAAEALANSEALLREVRALTRSVNKFAGYLTSALVIVGLCYVWKSGFVPWRQ